MRRLSGQESLINAPEFIKDATVQEFWRWAFSDLKMNDIRGIFAEWLVAKLLDIPLNVRDSWADHDLEKDGVKIEVKSSGYLQSWKQKKPSKIVFSGLKGRVYDYETNTYAPEATYNADVYIFCVQTEKNPEKWNALDLEQWEFYLLYKEDLEKLNQKTISLERVMNSTNSLNLTQISNIRRCDWL